MRSRSILMVVLALLAIAGCTKENDLGIPPDTTDGRVIGTVNGVVTDAATNAVLADVEVSLVRGESHVIQTTDETGLYSFKDLDSGTYSLTFTNYNDSEDYEFGIGITHVTIPTLEEVGIIEEPTTRNFAFEVRRDMDLFPLNGGATGYVFDVQMTPQAGVTVVADFECDRLALNEFTAVTNAEGKYTFASVLPTGMDSEYSELRTLPFQGLVAASVALDLHGGGVYQAEHLILHSANSPQITTRNYDSEIPFKVADSFTATFSVPMNTTTFVAELQFGDYETLVPVVTTWSEDGLDVTVNPDADLMYDSSYDLALTGWSMAGQRFTDTECVRTVGAVQPAVLSTNFSSDVPFARNGAFAVTFNMAMVEGTFVAELRSNGSGNLIPITKAWLANVVTVTPVNLLEANAGYTLTLRGFAATGVVFNQDWSVSTSEVTTPTATGDFEDMPVALVADLKVVFSEAMNDGSFTIDFTDEGDDDVLYAAAWSADKKTLTINPTLDLDAGSHYHLSLEGQSALGIHFADSWTVNTVRYQDVRVIEDTLVDDFALAGNLVITFSQAMDPASFVPVGQIVLMQNGSVHVFDVTWASGNTVLTINPRVDFQPGAEVELTLNGEAANGVALTPWSKDFTVYMGPAAHVISHAHIGLPNVYPAWTTPIVDGAVGLDDHLFFTFSEPMDTTLVTITLAGLDDPIHGKQTWINNVTTRFDPDVTLAASTEYNVGIDGTTLAGGVLAGGFGDIAGANDYNFEFTTVGGLRYQWNNLPRVDGSTAYVPQNQEIEIHFNLPLDLEASGTVVTLRNTTVLAAGVPIAITVTQPLPGVLRIVPNQLLPLATSYKITYRVYSNLPGDMTSTDDEDEFDGQEPTITFTTVASTVVACGQVTGVAQAADWLADFDETNIQLTWTREPNADGYRIYARNDDANKNDYFLVADVDQADGDLQAATFSIAGDPFDQIFDSRDDSADDVQTPFDGGDDVLFVISAYNTLNEGIVSAPATVSDEVAPTGGAFLAASASADNTTGAEDLIFTMRFNANEYLDTTVVPVVLVAEDEDTDVGDPDYAITDVISEYTDADGFTYLVLTFTVPVGKNGAGDLVTITGLKDSSGNDYDDDTPPVGTLFDTTAPTDGAFSLQSASADNSSGATPATFTLRYDASELLDETVDPTVTVGEATVPVNPAYTQSGVGATFVWDDVDGHTFIVITLTVDAGENAGGDVVTISGFQDLSGNVYSDATAPAAWTLVDTTAPFVVLEQSATSVDNSAGGATITVTFTVTATELLSHATLPVLTINTSAAVATDLTIAHINVAAPVWASEVGSNHSVLTYTITVHATDDFTLNGISCMGVKDLVLNAQAVASEIMFLN